jgi:signal transduction histidine kinase/ActR/RegA family two-component response regulator
LDGPPAAGSTGDIVKRFAVLTLGLGGPSVKPERSSTLLSRHRTALEWVALGVVLLAVTGSLALGLRLSRQAIESAELSRLEHQAHIVEQMLGTRLQATVNALDALRADVPALRAEAEGTARLGERMQVMVSSMAGVRTFLLVDASGRCTASNRRELLGTDFREGERYRTMSGHPDRATLYVSPPFMTPLGHWALSLGRVLLDARGGFDGYLLAIIDPEYFQLLLDSTRYAPDMTATMIHSGGKIVYRLPPLEGAAGMDLSERPESGFNLHLRSGREVSSWTTQLTTSGREALVVLRSIRPAGSTSDGYLVASFSREASALYAPWDKEVRDQGLALGVFGLATGLGLHVLQRRRADRRRQEAARLVLQAQIAESQKLESIGRLAGGVAHDFNNLLTIILSAGSEALGDARQGRPSDQGLMEELLAAAGRAADLTRQLLTFARKQVIAPVTLDLNEQLRSSQKLLRRVFGEEVQVVERLEADLWPVRCDPGLFSQLILNLAVNARDAMTGDGTLTLSTANRTVGPGDPAREPAMPPGDYVRLQVEDSGAGMTPEVMAHLYEPFFTTKEPGRGTGLGLSTVYGIVKQSGAHIGVRSAPGHGTSFEIWFPREAEPPAPPPPAAAVPEGGRETILVVEDEQAVRAVVAHSLRAGGYRVLEASGIEEALAHVEAERGALDLLLTDVVMPRTRGPEVARQLRSRRPGLRVLYMSGHAQDAIGRQGVLEEGLDFVAKPFTPDALRARVRQVLDRPAHAT